jgi:hypothetical protein
VNPGRGSLTAKRARSVLEPGRTLTLAERGGEGAEEIVAAPGAVLGHSFLFSTHAGALRAKVLPGA